MGELTLSEKNLLQINPIQPIEKELLGITYARNSLIEVAEAVREHLKD